MSLEAFEWDGRKPTVALVEHPFAGMSGIDMATALVSRKTCAEVPIVVCSNEIGRIPDDVALRLNIVDQIPKPVGHKRLFDALRKSLPAENPTVVPRAGLNGGSSAPTIAVGGTAVSKGGRLDQERPAEGAASGAVEASARLLVVEDLEENREIVRLYLKHLPYEIEMATNGLEGLRHFTAGQFDLVLMDMQMPLMDGCEATASIRSWEREHSRTPTPIVALTASAFTEDIERAIDAGCDAYIVKPVRKAVLLETIGQHVRRANERAA